MHDKSLVLQLLLLSVNYSCHCFNGKKFDSVAISYSLGSTIAKLSLAYYERKLLDNCPIQFRSRYYGIYVD